MWKVRDVGGDAVDDCARNDTDVTAGGDGPSREGGLDNRGCLDGGEASVCVNQGNAFEALDASFAFAGGRKLTKRTGLSAGEGRRGVGDAPGERRSRNVGNWALLGGGP